MSGPLIDLNGRVRDRAREARQRRVRRWLIAAAVTVVVGALVWVATASSLFSVRTVQVVGNSVVPAEAITSAAAIRLGTPLAQVDGAGASRRLAAVPGVARGDVSVALPDTVTIRITERTVAYVVAIEGGFRWIDPTGQGFTTSEKRPDGVPLAEVSNADDQRLMADVATVTGALPARLAARVEKVTAETRDSIVVHTTGGAEIVWGSIESSSLKGQTADALATAQPKCKHIDVSSPTHPVTRC